MSLSDKKDTTSGDDEFRPLFAGNVSPAEAQDSFSRDETKKKATEIFKSLYDKSQEPAGDGDFASLYKSDNALGGGLGNSGFNALYSRDEPEPLEPERSPVPDHDGPLESTEDIPDEDVPLPVEPEVQVDEGAAKGWEDGFSKGEAEGLEKGHAEGKEKGYEEGFVKGREEGYGEGLVSGEKDGAEKAAEAAAEQVAHLETMLLGLGTLWDDMIKKNEDRIIDLIARTAGRVVAGKVEIDDDIVRRTILEALEMMPEVEEVSIGVNPEDYEYVETVKEEFFKRFSELQRVSVMSNPSVARGGCKVESKTGEVNASLEQRLDAVTKSLIGAGK